MKISYNIVVDRRDHVQYLTVSKSYSDNCTCSLMMMMSWSLTTHQPFWVISVIKVIKRSITEH